MALGRRSFLGTLTLLLAGLGRRVWSQGFALRYQPLARPVVISLESLATPWRAQQFVAEGMTLSSAANPNQPLRITGMVVRTAAGNDPEKFTAVCLKCPHEGCDVDFVPDPNKLAPEVKKEIGHPVEHSVYECPCHNSTFLAEDGERVAGPAPRGLYRFRVTKVSDAAIEIGEVEEDVLLFT